MNISSEELDKKSISVIPKAKMKEMTDYAKRLKKKHPHMKADRLTRNVAKKFGVHLIDDAGNSFKDTGR